MPITKKQTDCNCQDKRKKSPIHFYCHKDWMESKYQFHVDDKIAFQIVR